MSGDLGQSIQPSAFTRPMSETSFIVAGVVMTLLLHGVIVGLVILGTWHKGERIQEELAPKMLEFEDVELLALGEKKPPNALKRISNPPPPDTKPDQVAIEKDPNAVILDKDKKDKPKDEPPPKEEKKQREDAMLDALSALHDPERPTNTDLPEGDAAGVAGGKLSDAALANLMNTYAAKLKATILRYRTAPTTLSDEQIAQLDRKLAIYIRISKDGHIVSYSWKTRSGDDLFDESVETTLKKFMVQYGGRQLPMPEDAQVLAAVLQQGLLFTGQ